MAERLNPMFNRLRYSIVSEIRRIRRIPETGKSRPLVVQGKPG